MKTLLTTIMLAATAATTAQAADFPVKTPSVAPVRWTWTGLYVGAHLGAGWGQSDFDDATGPVVFGNRVRTPAALAGGQIGYNWQLSDRPFVAGIEADLSALGADGTNTCFATSGYLVSSNCRVRQEAMGSLTGRIGYAAGPAGHSLLYAKAGGAWLRERVDISNPDDATMTRSDRFGWTVGAGVEQAITPAWSMKLEYDYADFGMAHVATPAAGFQNDPPLPSSYIEVPGTSSSVRQTLQTVKLGLNMKLGADPAARWDAIAARPLGLPVKAMASGLPLGMEVEVGGRVWYSFGRFQKDLGNAPDPTLQDRLLSRLTYNTAAASGEVFGRLDTASNIVIKGFVGGGGLPHGSMNDEDWLISRRTVPYSNTLSDPVTGSIAYATADLGYDVFRDRAGKFAVFVGYNYFHDDKAARSCTQLANPYSACEPPISDGSVIITEKDDWHSLRLGFNGVMALTEQLQLTADAAYLPWVKFRGQDDHVLRTEEATTISNEYGTGQGVQLEAVLSYKITPSFSVGAGGRYWAMWATKGDAYTDSFGTGCPCQALPVRTERFGGFLQASYTFDSFR